MRPLRRLPLLLLVLPVLLLGRPAVAKLDGKAWREVQDAANRLFAAPGEAEAKAEVVARLVEDGEGRAWKILVDALVKEAELWIQARQAVDAKVEEIARVLTMPSSERRPKDEAELHRNEAALPGLEEAAKAERAVLEAIAVAVAQGPEVLRKSLYQRARSAPEWTVRAAAVRVAAAKLDEEISFSFLQRALDADKDPRVRLAGLEGLRDHEGDLSDAAVALVLGRIADKEWGVQLLAVRIVNERLIKRAVPHLISALEFAGPRVGKAIGEILQELTGENFEPYADVWARWWEDHKGEFQSEERVRGGRNQRPPSDASFYGLPIESDRVLFIIDVSGSMKLETKNDNPAAAPPPPPITGEGAPPPPPPPEEILSGPKIDVAKHELKKALKALPAQTMFNIISFNHAVIPWKDAMVQATDANKEDALTWVRALKPSGSTYVDGALRLAFRMAGLGAVDDKYPEVNVDTIILLSDGAPTDNGFPESKLMEPDVIIEHVKEWNRNQRVVINCIGVDMVDGIEFLRRLALENGGTYVDR